jgi:hypothetical protein
VTYLPLLLTGDGFTLVLAAGWQPTSLHALRCAEVLTDFLLQ